MNRKLVCLLFAVASAVLLNGTANAITLSVTSDLILHLDSDDATADGSGNVSSWNDQSGSGNHATQGTLANQPTLVPSVTPTGKGVLRFDSQNDTTPEHLLIAANASDFDASALTWFVVFRQGTQTNNKRLFSSGYNDINPDAAGAVESQAWGTITDVATDPNDTSLGYRSLARTKTEGFNAASAGGGKPGVLNTTDFFVGASTFDSATDMVAATVTSPDGSSASDSNTNATLQLVDHVQTLIGAQAGDDMVVDSNGWSGDIAALIVYDRVLTSNEIATVTEELRLAYSVPEPATLCLALIGGLVMLKPRR